MLLFDFEAPAQPGAAGPAVLGFRFPRRPDGPAPGPGQRGRGGWAVAAQRGRGGAKGGTWDLKAFGMPLVYSGYSGFIVEWWFGTGIYALIYWKKIKGCFVFESDEYGICFFFVFHLLIYRWMIIVPLLFEVCVLPIPWLFGLVVCSILRLMMWTHGEQRAGCEGMVILELWMYSLAKPEPYGYENRYDMVWLKIMDPPAPSKSWILYQLRWVKSGCQIGHVRAMRWTQTQGIQVESWTPISCISGAARREKSVAAFRGVKLPRRVGNPVSLRLSVVFTCCDMFSSICHPIWDDAWWC